MKVQVFLLWVFFLLFGAGNYLYANTSQSKKSAVSKENFLKKNHLKITKVDQNDLIIEETDVDFEEELHNDNSIKIKYLIRENFFLKSIYNFDSKLFVLNYFNNRFEIFSPFSGYSNPIYISIQVLRI